jgi:hypothetical protein
MKVKGCERVHFWLVVAEFGEFVQIRPISLSQTPALGRLLGSIEAELG